MHHHWLSFLLLLLVRLGGATEAYPPLHDDIKTNFISATLGSNMVLQRDAEVHLWGYVSSGTKEEELVGTMVTTVLYREEDSVAGSRRRLLLLELQTTVVNQDGLWRQAIPPQRASLQSFAVTVTSAATQQNQTLSNLLFGDVYLCGGQSNMQFALPATTNGTHEAHSGIHYPHVRVFTVGQGTPGTAMPLPDLQTVQQPWSVASEYRSLFGDGTPSLGGAFSAVCWFFGRRVADGLANQVPIGLISNNWGGTAVERWQKRGGGDLYNAMIYPYTVGPMALTGFIWYQGEANTKDQTSADAYAENFPALIEQWRSDFTTTSTTATTVNGDDNNESNGYNSSPLYFGFVQLSTWCPEHPVAVAELRQAQMAALSPPSKKIGYATNADHGAGCNIHPPDKQYCGARLGDSALALQYGQDDITWKSPSYSKATTTAQAAAATTILRGSTATTTPPVIAVEFQDVSSEGLYLLEEPYNTARVDPQKFTCEQQPEGVCEAASVLLNGSRG